jgi:hypothetical protein
MRKVTTATKTVAALRRWLGGAGAGLDRFLRQGISPAAIFLNLAVIILLRMFLEELLEDGHRFFQPWDSYNDLNYYLHMFASWVCIFLTMTLPVKAFLGLRYRASALFICCFVGPLFPLFSD